MVGIKKSRFSTNIYLYLTNDIRQSHSYYDALYKSTFYLLTYLSRSFLNGTTLNNLKWPKFQDHDIIQRQTSVSETIREPPLVKAQTAFKKINFGEKRFSIWRMELLHPAMWYDHDIDFARWLNPAMWYVALGSWQWIHQVAAPCYVIRSSGMTCRWIRPVAAPCNVAGGSKMTCHVIRPNVRHIGILHLVSILTVSPQSTSHSAPVCEILSKSDHPQQKKMT